MLLVVPYIGTWIETYGYLVTAKNRYVVPYIGTWIETSSASTRILTGVVVPYIGTWIETLDRNNTLQMEKSRTLYRYVD